jgi:hypothetical protein
MSLEEIKRHRADLLLRCQELENHVFVLQRESGYLSGNFEQIAKLLAPPDQHDKRGSFAVSARDVEALKRLLPTLDCKKALELASDLNQAIAELASANQKKIEFGLR